MTMSKSNWVMYNVAWTLALLSVGVWSYVIGTIMPQVQTLSTLEEERTAYIVSQDHGCDDIIRTTDGRLVCEVALTHEDDAIFIIKKEGARDNYINQEHERTRTINQSIYGLAVSSRDITKE